MKTNIYKNYEEFLNRTDKTLNGVSEQFSKNNEDYENMNNSNKSCWNCSGCSRCSDCAGCSDCSDCAGCSRCSDCSGCSRCSDCAGCSDCSDCAGCSRCSDCAGCSDCSDCAGCSRCSDCAGCSRCSDCAGCSDKKESKKSNILLNPPKIKNIHKAIFNATNKENALDMGKWHTCGTTHCRGGWVVTLAGKKGKELENKTSTLFAAMMIYKASSEIRVSPTRFFDNNLKAMEDIKNCAELELKGGQ